MRLIIIGAGYGQRKPGERIFQTFIQRAKENKSKMLANYDVKGNIAPATQKLRSKILASVFNNNMTIIFYKKIIHIFLTDEPVGF